MPRYFDLLAPEIIQIIFIFCVEKRNEYFIEFSYDTAPLVLLRVCKRWQYIAYQTPVIFDSISLRRRVHEPIGFDFNRDSWILSDFLHFPRSGYRTPARPRPLSMQICYGDIKYFGDKLMWSDLLRMVRIIIDTTGNLERLYLRFPDDCMEKFLMKICSESKGVSHENLRSLTLHSTREGILAQRYITWWFDVDSDLMPAYYHKLDTTHLPALEELGLHFPGPLTLDPVCQSVRKLHVSIFKWEQLEEYLTGCPNVEHVTLELRDVLLEQDWEILDADPSEIFPRVRTLEIRSGIKGMYSAQKLCKLFLGLRIPNLKVLRLRRLPQAVQTDPPIFCFGALIMRTLDKLEELEFIDFPPEVYGTWEIGALFTATPNLRRLAYRELDIVSSAEYFARLISELTFFGKELRAPRLEILELDSVHLREGATTLVQAVLQLIASRRIPSFFVNTGGFRRGKAAALPCLLRKVLLPLGCSDIVRQMDVLGMCRGVEFDCVPTLDVIETEDDLDQEGPPREGSYEWNRLKWQLVREPEILMEHDSYESFGPNPHGAGQSSTQLPSESMVEVEEMLDEDMDDGECGTPTCNSQGPSGLNRYDSLAEVERLL